jgi:hypothetical protein
MRFVFLAILGALSLWSPRPTQAQTPVAMYCYQGPTNPQWSPCSASNQLQVSASVTASVTGFAPNGNYASITSAGTSGSVALPAGAVVVFSNTGTTTVSCTLGVGSATAVAGEIQIPASSSVAFTVGSNTFGACIDQTGSTSNTVVLAGGTGLFTGFGGGGGGSGGSVTQGTSPWVDNITQFGGTNISTGTGTGGAGIPRVTVSSDSFPATQAVSGTVTTTPPSNATTNLTQVNSVALGSPSAYGTSPGAVNVPGVNAFVTNSTTAIPNNADGVAVQTGASNSPTNDYAYLFNGTTWDRARSGTQTGSTLTNGATNTTATACSATVVTGGTAVNAFTAQTTLHGFTIANIDTTEVMWISFTGTAVASGTDSYPLPAATATTFAGFGSFTSPPGFGLNHALSVVAATNGHKFSCTWW